MMAGSDPATSSPFPLEAPEALEPSVVEVNKLKSIPGVWAKQRDEELHRKMEVQERKTPDIRLTRRAAQQENRRLKNVMDQDVRKNWRPHFFHYVAFVLVFAILQLYTPSPPVPSFSVLQASTNSSAMTHRTTTGTSATRPKVRIKAYESRPPKPMELFETKDPAILLRHKCIAAIRTRHADFYKSVFPSGQILLVDPAYHGNVGDHMLTLAEQQFIKRMSLKPPLECDYMQAGRSVPPCSEVLKMQLPNDISVAMWQAGGNWGDIWRSIQKKRIESFRKLLKQNLTVISMPQSLHYKSSHFEKEDSDSIRRITLGRNGVAVENSTRSMVQTKMIFTWREHESFERASNLYPLVNNIIVPEIAFQLGPYPSIPPKEQNRVDLLIFLRKDTESNIGHLRNETVIDEILRNMGKPGITYQVVEWEDRLTIFKSDDSLFTDTSIQLLSLGRVVVCDRLHAATLAYLSGLPFVFMDQNTGKIAKALRVAFESSEDCSDGEKARWAKATSLEHGIKTAVDFLDRYKLRSASA